MIEAIPLNRYNNIEINFLLGGSIWGQLKY